MKKRLLKTLAAVLMLSTLFCTAAFAAGWEKQTQGWVYWLDDGNVATDTWITDEDGNSYYVGSDGVMVTNSWLPINGKWYYLDSNGLMVKGTMLGLDNNNTWYLMGNDGAMETNVWYFNPTPTDEDPNKGDWYYFGSDGVAYKNGWYNIDGYEYYFLKSSKMAHDALVPGGGYVGSDGRRIS